MDNRYLNKIYCLNEVVKKLNELFLTSISQNFAFPRNTSSTWELNHLLGQVNRYSGVTFTLLIGVFILYVRNILGKTNISYTPDTHTHVGVSGGKKC